MVIKDLPITKEINFLKKYYKRLFIIKLCFPFISIMALFFSKDFEQFQKSRHKEVFDRNFHFINWILVFGKEQRIKFDNNEKIVYSYIIRNAYEQVLLSIYEAIINKDKSVRRAYKFSLNIARSIFIYEKDRDFSNISELKEFLISKDLNPDFINHFFNLPKTNFQCNNAFLFDLLFYDMKLIDYLNYKPKNNNKKINSTSFELKNERSTSNLKLDNVYRFLTRIDRDCLVSAYISKSIFKANSYYLYLVVNDNISNKKFGKFLESILNNFYFIEFFNDEISKKIGDRYGYNFRIYPFVVKKSLLKNDYFICGRDALESISFNNISKRLFGEELRMNIDYSKIKHSSYVNLQTLSFCGLQNFFLSNNLRPKQKNDEIIKQFMAYRLLNKKRKIMASDLDKEYFKEFDNKKCVKEWYSLIRKSLREGYLI